MGSDSRVGVGDLVKDRPLAFVLWEMNHLLSPIGHVSRARAQHTAALYSATAKGEKTSLVQIIYPVLNIRDKESLTKTRTETTPLLGFSFQLANSAVDGINSRIDVVVESLVVLPPVGILDYFSD